MNQLSKIIIASSCILVICCKSTPYSSLEENLYNHDYANRYFENERDLDHIEGYWNLEITDNMFNKTEIQKVAIVKMKDSEYFIQIHLDQKNRSRFPTIFSKKGDGKYSTLSDIKFTLKGIELVGTLTGSQKQRSVSEDFEQQSTYHSVTTTFRYTK